MATDTGKAVGGTVPAGRTGADVMSGCTVSTYDSPHSGQGASSGAGQKGPTAPSANGGNPNPGPAYKN